LDTAALFCDELVLLDTGSGDSTAKEARAHGATVHDWTWGDDFAAARNASFDACSGDWIVWLDADDVLPVESRRAFIAVKAELSDHLDVISSPYHWKFAADGSPLLSKYVPRLVRRAARLRWVGRVYEQLPVPPGRGTFNGALVVEHRPDPHRRASPVDGNISILDDAVASGDRSSATLFHYANELYDQGDHREAELMYRQYLALDEEDANRYWALLYLGESRAALGDDVGAEEAAFRAVAEDSSRAEAYMLLGRLRFERDEWDEAIPLFLAASGARKPPSGFVRFPDYLYMPWDYLSVCYEKVGRLADGLLMSLNALRSNPEAERIRANMRWIIDHL
jgi:tetratricopeptide (TPR) repeat protein